MRYPIVVIDFRASCDWAAAAKELTGRLSWERLFSTTSMTVGSRRLEVQSLGEHQAERIAEEARESIDVEDVEIAPAVERFAPGRVYTLYKRLPYEPIPVLIKVRCTSRTRSGGRASFAIVGDSPGEADIKANILTSGARELFGEVAVINGNILFSSHEIS